MVNVSDRRRIEGIVHWHQESQVVRSRGRLIEVSQDNGASFFDWCLLPERLPSKLLSKHRLGRRLGRRNIKHLSKLDEENWICIDRDAIWTLASGCRTPKHRSILHGSRPLRIVAKTGRVLYGEYRGNKTRTPISLWKSNGSCIDWEPAYQFEGIRHIHGVFEDPKDASVWVTSGDLDGESAIWRMNSEMTHATKICGGSQQFRVIDLVFHNDQIYFGTDAPEDQNAIYRMGRDGTDLKKLQSVAGPVFHGRSFQGGMVFTTACEPSLSNQYSQTEVWFSRTGSSWQRLMTFKKDPWSMKYFQYGQVMLASGEGDAKGFWITPFATQYDQRSLFIRFESDCGPGISVANR